MDSNGQVIVMVGEDSPLRSGVETALRERDATVVPVPPARVATRAEAEAAFADIVADHGPVTAVVTALFPPEAAVTHPMADLDDERFDAIWERPMRTLLSTLQAAYVGFLDADPRGGRVVVIVPTIAMSGGSGFSIAAAAAEGQRLLVKSVARQWGPEGVIANTLAVAPALVIPDAPDFEYSLAERALGRVGDPDHDLGPIVAFLCGEDNRFVTGSTIIADGGLWMSAA